MYELVNTSLPNGLIPGSHGFAAVAMTKGFPEPLRTRIEAYCAYSHRTSAHDATYFTENPVNWFHVTLPQGDHVLGRVAPADFDYTGRTNRLARLLVFSRNEMPEIGGASVLAKERARLSEAWSGEARWLEADKLNLGRMRLEIPPVNCNAPSWRAMFGNAEGLSLAKGFARLLAKNLQTTGRTIYFKTSTAHDADGTTLLALFADLIDLLPPADRRNVNFSTYPVALPQGTICHLRGVYDRDRIFDAAVATQPWVDCEKGVVHNASLLPPEEVKSSRIEPKVGTASVHETPQTPLPAYETRQQATPTWMHPPKKDGTKVLFIGFMAIAVLLVTAAATCSIYLWRENEHKIRESERQRQLAVAETIRVAEEKRMFKAEQEAAAKAQAEARLKKAEEDKAKAKAKAKAKQEQQDLKQKDEERKRNEKRKKAEHRSQVTQSDKTPAFVSALSVEEIGALPEQKSILDIAKDHFKTNETLKVFWYDSYGILTNRLAGFVESKYSSYFSPKLDELRKLKNSPRCFFLIWYDCNDKKAYWDWSPLIEKEPDKWFENTNTYEICLVDMCFGGTANEAYKTWLKHFGTPRFTIYWVAADGKSIPIPQKIERTLKLEALLEMYGEQKDKQQKTSASKNKELLKNYITKVSRINIAQRSYNDCKNELQIKQINLKNCRKDKGKRDAIKEEIKAKQKKIEDIWNNLDKDDRSFYGVALKYNSGKIEQWDKLLEALDKKIEELKSKLQQPDKTPEEKKHIRELIRNSKFCIKNVEGAKQ